MANENKYITNAELPSKSVTIDIYYVDLDTISYNPESGSLSALIQNHSPLATFWSGGTVGSVSLTLSNLDGYFAACNKVCFHCTDGNVLLAHRTNSYDDNLRGGEFCGTFEGGNYSDTPCYFYINTDKMEYSFYLGAVAAATTLYLYNCGEYDPEGGGENDLRAIASAMSQSIGSCVGGAWESPSTLYDEISFLVQNFGFPVTYDITGCDGGTLSLALTDLYLPDRGDYYESGVDFIIEGN